MNKMMVLAKAVPGQVDTLGRWYDEQHIPDLLAVPGVVSAERHTLVPLKAPEGVPQWDFMLVYEFAGGDPMAVLGAMGAAQQSGAIQFIDALESADTLSLVGVSLGKRKPDPAG